MFAGAVVDICSGQLPPQAEKPPASHPAAEEIVACYDVIKKLLKAAEESGFQVEKLLEAAK